MKMGARQKVTERKLFLVLWLPMGLTEKLAKFKWLKKRRDSIKNRNLD